MTQYLNIFSKDDIQKYFSQRNGETKIGETIQCIQNKTNWIEELKTSTAKFVIIGIPEDIGVRANLGRRGAHSAFNAVLSSFLSMQDNQYLNANTCLLLGNIYVEDLMLSAESLDSKHKEHIIQLRKLVEIIDERVFEVAKIIFQHHKIPIVIGGGHNNAYPLIKAASVALSMPINAINCDAHSDLRIKEGRHSGNGFRYAIDEGFLYHYHILGLHEQYTSRAVFEYIHSHSVTYYTYEDIFIREKISFSEALKNSVFLVKERYCGVELDVDAITNVPSSARTSSGISPIDARKYIYTCSKLLNCVYLHLAEAAPETAHKRADYKTGKLLAYLISDFIKGQNEK
jgi:formiminoglutamase